MKKEYKEYKEIDWDDFDYEEEEINDLDLPIDYGDLPIYYGNLSEQINYVDYFVKLSTL